MLSIIFLIAVAAGIVALVIGVQKNKKKAVSEPIEEAKAPELVRAKPEIVKAPKVAAAAKPKKVKTPKTK